MAACLAYATRLQMAVTTWLSIIPQTESALQKESVIKEAVLILELREGIP